MSELKRPIHRWTSAYRLHGQAWSELQRSWLLDRASLTKRLMTHCRQQFEVEVRKEGVGKLFQHEKRALKCASDSAWIREVALKVDGQVWVLARSAVPLSTLTGPDIKLRYLGNKPLGHLLFSNPRYRRNQFEIGKVATSNGDLCWGRRSIFHCQGTDKTLLVSETFMPVVFCQQSS